MNYPVVVSVKVDVNSIKDKFLKQEVQNLISQKIYQVIEVVLSALDLQETHKVWDFAFMGGQLSSFEMLREKFDPRIIEALVVGVLKFESEK